MAYQTLEELQTLLKNKLVEFDKDKKTLKELVGEYDSFYELANELDDEEEIKRANSRLQNMEKNIKKVETKLNSLNFSISKMYTDLILEKSLSVQKAVKYICEFYKFSNSDGDDLISSFCNNLFYVKDEAYVKSCNILLSIIDCKEIPVRIRHKIAISFKGLNRYDLCYNIFTKLATDTSNDHDYRFDCVKYLFVSEIHKPKSLEIMLEILADSSIEAKKRFEYLQYFGKKRIYFKLDKFVDMEEVDYEFLTSLIMEFFYNEKNDIRYRAMCFELIVRIPDSFIKKKDKNDMCLTLAKSLDDKSIPYNVRADMSDILMRTATVQDIKLKARDTIQALAREFRDDKTIAGKIFTFYENAQNVHDDKITKSAEEFIAKLYNTEYEIKAYEIARSEFEKYIDDRLKARKEKREALYAEEKRKKKNTKESEEKLENENNKDRQEMFKVKDALHRILIDSGLFTSRMISLKELFSLVWAKIVSSEEIDVLCERLFEEFLDMNDTCSSGHCIRLVNVFSGICEDAIQIDYKTEIIANISARVNSRLKKLSDDEKGLICLGMMDNADEEERVAYFGFLNRVLPEVHKELHDEYVEGDYITETEFETHYSEGAAKLGIK